MSSTLNKLLDKVMDYGIPYSKASKILDEWK